jgi:hypothetical protein
MIYNIEYLKDFVGNNYLGIKVGDDMVEPFLNDLKDHLGENDYKVFTENQQKRDSGHHHITVINVMEFNSLSKSGEIGEFVNSLNRVFEYPIDDLRLMGIGSATKNENTSYFIVVQSENLDSIRDRYNLPKHDFHITIGFKWKDVHGVRKNEILKPRSKFLKLLADEFYKKENFNFLKRIDNFKGNPDLDIIPISISDNYIKISSGDTTMDIGILDEPQKFWVMASYKSESEPKRLPQTEILRILDIKK